MRPGQDIVIMGYIGLEWTVKAAEEERETLRRTLPEDFLDRTVSLRKYEGAEEYSRRFPGLSRWEAGESGIFAALWDMAEHYGAGLTVDLKRFPVRQETIEICEALGQNPYEISSRGCVLLAADNGNDIVWEAGVPAAFIGKVTGNRDRILRNGEHIRYLNRPGSDGREADKRKEFEDEEEDISGIGEGQQA